MVRTTTEQMGFSNKINQFLFIIFFVLIFHFSTTLYLHNKIKLPSTATVATVENDDYVRVQRKLERTVEFNNQHRALRLKPVLKVFNNAATKKAEKLLLPREKTALMYEQEIEELKMKHRKEIETMKKEVHFFQVVAAAATDDFSKKGDKQRSPPPSFSPPPPPLPLPPLPPLLAPATPIVRECNFVTSLATTKTFNLALVSESKQDDMSTDNTDYFAYVPSEYDSKETRSYLHVLANVLNNNRHIDVVGFYLMESNGLLVPQCHHIDLCHWTVIKHREYYCSNFNLAACDQTSNVFVSRKKFYNLIDWEIDKKVRTLDFFIQMKKRNGFVVSLIGPTVVKKKQEIPPSSSSSSSSSPSSPSSSQSFALIQGILKFVIKYAVTEILDRDTKMEIDLCKHIVCDGHLHQSIMGDTWDHLGTTMPPFFYKRFVDAFVEATKFLESIKIKYWICGGASLGLLKFNRLLPWDAGDVDFYVDPDSFPGGCTEWLKRLKAWANAMNFKHPHTSGNGQSCEHYGVYAVPPSTYVNDPYSMGLVTFTKATRKSEQMPAVFPEHEGYIQTFLYPEDTFLQFASYGVRTKVFSNFGDKILSSYFPHPLRHSKHYPWKSYKNTSCQSEHAKFPYNCLDTDIDTGSSKDKCIEHTAFFHYGVTQYYNNNLESREEECDGKNSKEIQTQTNDTAKNHSK